MRPFADGSKDALEAFTDLGMATNDAGRLPIVENAQCGHVDYCQLALVSCWPVELRQSGLIGFWPRIRLWHQLTQVGLAGCNAFRSPKAIGFHANLGLHVLNLFLSHDDFEV